MFKKDGPAEDRALAHQAVVAHAAEYIVRVIHLSVCRLC
jgi:hypothetical protein